MGSYLHVGMTNEQTEPTAGTVVYQQRAAKRRPLWHSCVGQSGTLTAISKAMIDDFVYGHNVPQRTPESKP